MRLAQPGGTALAIPYQVDGDGKQQRAFPMVCNVYCSLSSLLIRSSIIALGVLRLLRVL